MAWINECDILQNLKLCWDSFGQPVDLRHQDYLKTTWKLLKPYIKSIQKLLEIFQDHKKH